MGKAGRHTDLVHGGEDLESRCAAIEANGEKSFGSASLRAVYQQKWGRTAARPQGYTQMTNTNVAPIGQPNLAFVREGAIKMSPAQANAILNVASYARNRKLSDEAVKTLSEIMRRGEWRDKDQIAFGRFPNGYLMLVNGHHRMKAQALSGKDITWSVVIHEVSGEDEFKELYYSYDTNVRTRSSSHILNASGFGEETGMKKNIRNSLYRAAPIIAAGLNAANRNRTEEETFVRRIADDRIKAMNSFFAEALVMQEFLSGRHGVPETLRKRLMQAGVFAVALVCLRADPERGAEFWGGLIENDRLLRLDPRAVLNNWLIDNASVSKSVNSGIVASVKAWNAFVDEKEIRIIKIQSGVKTPMRLAGYVVQP